MMLDVPIENQRYAFYPQGRESPAIEVVCYQEYSPGQTRKTDEVCFEVPSIYAARLSEELTCDNLAQAIRLLAATFCNGDESKVELQHIQP